jgi:hypothetical protein
MRQTFSKIVTFISKKYILKYIPVFVFVAENLYDFFALIQGIIEASFRIFAALYFK